MRKITVAAAVAFFASCAWVRAFNPVAFGNEAHFWDDKAVVVCLIEKRDDTRVNEKPPAVAVHAKVLAVAATDRLVPTDLDITIEYQHLLGGLKPLLPKEGAKYVLLIQQVKGQWYRFPHIARFMLHEEIGGLTDAKLAGFLERLSRLREESRNATVEFDKSGRSLVPEPGAEAPAKDVPGGTRKNTTMPALDAAVKRLVSARIRSVKLDIRYWFVDEANDLWAPGYVDNDARVFFRWKGVSLKGPDVPGRNMTSDISTLIDPEAYRIVDIDPPIDLALLQGGRYAPGYYSWGTKSFYRWKGVVLTEQQA